MTFRRRLGDDGYAGSRLLYATPLARFVAPAWLSLVERVIRNH